jgi:glucuronoarabinoxylan endo-1,4-beta-xylanase
VDVVSIQNEPNIKVTYESCTWSATQLLNFCKNNASAIGKPVMMPEAFNFSFALSDSTLNDATARSQVTYIGGHLYGTTPRIYANAETNKKKVWMTEHYYTSESIDTCLTIAKEIVDCIYNDMSAYIWWYLRQPGCNIINTGGSIKKKGYAIGQFSKFIRPGYSRIDATYQPQTGVYVIGCIGAQMAVVAVNRNTTSQSQTFTFQNCQVTSLEKYTTSNTKNISDDGPLTVSGNSLTVTLDAQSITTFVGKAVTTSIDFFAAPLKSSSNPNYSFLRAGNQSLVFYSLSGQKFIEGQAGSIDFKSLSRLVPGAYVILRKDGDKLHEKITWCQGAR